MEEEVTSGTPISGTAISGTTVHVDDKATAISGTTVHVDDKATPQTLVDDAATLRTLVAEEATTPRTLVDDKAPAEAALGLAAAPIRWGDLAAVASGLMALAFADSVDA